MNDIWKNWNQVRELCKDKKVVFWGRSEDWVHKTIQELSDIHIECIIDMNLKYKDTQYYNIPVESPEKLQELGEDIFIIITGGSYESIMDSILDLGFKAGSQFCCSPIFKDWALLHEIREYEQNLLITSSDHSENEGGKRYSKLGGGLYTFNTRTHELEKKVNGHFRQIVEVDELYYIVEYVEKLVYVVNKNYEIVNKYEIDQSKEQKEKPNACGIAYYAKKELFYVANAGNDIVNIYEKNGFKFIDQIKISEKSTNAGGGLHHINDLTIVDDTLLVSCFSVTGNWKKDFLDGGLFEYDLNNVHKEPNILCNHLWKPHSIEYINNKICYLDSMRGNLWMGNQKILGNFNGFARALSYDGKYYFIGQSEAMYLKELFNINSNTILNSGIYLFDAENRISRFHTIPYLSNIHDIHVIK